MQKDHFYWPNHSFRNRNWSTSPRVTCSNFSKRSINERGYYKVSVLNSPNCDSSRKEKKTWHHGSLVFTRVSASSCHCFVRYQSDLVAFSVSFRCSKNLLTAISFNFFVIVCLDFLFSWIWWDPKHSHHLSFSLSTLLVTVSEV